MLRRVVRLWFILPATIIDGRRFILQLHSGPRFRRRDGLLPSPEKGHESDDGYEYKDYDGNDSRIGGATVWT